ncbi:hypothetical protein MTO96_013849 [Rhipicephalus appendiculatus]
MRRGVKSRRLPHSRPLSRQAPTTGVEDPPEILLDELGSGILRPVTWVGREKAATTRDVGAAAPAARLAERGGGGGCGHTSTVSFAASTNPVATKTVGLIVWRNLWRKLLLCAQYFYKKLQIRPCPGEAEPSRRQVL